PPIDKTYTYVQNPEVYSSNDLFPSQAASVSSDGVLRQQRVAGISLFPVQYNPVSQELIVYESITVTVSFTGSTTPNRRAVSPESDAYEALFKADLLNYPSASAWRLPVGTQIADLLPATASSLPWAPPNPGWKIKVGSDGIYKVTYAELSTAGLPVDSLDPQTFQLFYLGNEVAIRVSGEQDGKFDPADAIFFYGQAVSSKYTKMNVYWLTYGKTTGLRMSTRDVTPGAATVPVSYDAFRHMESNNYYIGGAGGDAAQDRWLWNYYYTTGGISKWSSNFTLGLPYTGPAKMKIAMWGYTDLTIDPDHDVIVTLNGTQLGEFKWDGFNWMIAEMDIMPGILMAGINNLEAKFGNNTGSTIDTVWFDWVELTYANNFQADLNQLEIPFSETGAWNFGVDGFNTDLVDVYDVTAPGAVVQLDGVVSSPSSSGYKANFQDDVTDIARYWAIAQSVYKSVLAIEPDTASNLQSTSNGADYILITYQDFASAAETLVDFRASQGLRSVSVDVADVMDEFGYGIVGPEPIRAFLAYAYSSWQAPAPSYVVLLGDANFDPKDYAGLHVINYMPTYLAPVDPYIGETSADNYYVSLVGSDNLPDMMLGRLSVTSAAEASTLVNKITAYEQAPFSGPWTQQVLSVADMPDEAGNFNLYSDALLNCCLKPGYQASKVYYGVTHITASDARNAIKSGINAGKLIVNYIGHAWYGGWATDDLLTTGDVASLTNGSKLPIVLGMDCRDGYFIWPYSSMTSLAEKLTRASNGGAVASWSPTGDGITAAHDYLNRGFLLSIFESELETVGSATLAGKLNLFATGSDLDLMDTYLLFGDPAMQVSILPDPPVLQGPTGTISSINPTFTWTSIQSAVDYNLVVTTDDGGPLMDQSSELTGTKTSADEVLNITVPVSSCNAGICSYKTADTLNLQPGDYIWTVRAGLGNGLYTGFADNLAFSNLAVPEAVTPLGTITYKNPKFTWKIAAGAQKYALLVTKGVETVLSQEIESSTCGTTTCSYTSPTTLNLALGDYTWTVKAYFTFWGDFGKVTAFNVAAPPAPKFPSISSTTPNPKFIWSKVADQTKYRIILYTANNQVLLNKIITAPVCTSTTCSYTPSPALGLVNGTYKWKVQSYNGAWGVYSALKYFKKVNPPTPISPTGKITGKNPVFKWTVIPGAAKYTLEIRKSTGTLVKSLVLTKAQCNCGTTNCSYTPVPSLNLGIGSYKWRVKAYNGYFGPFSSYLAFSR
ncbi:MAG TPA: C25 family cysteine peptidase, partial [Anaerolineaceae bacterium]|nr:C25 family cysteine peptidase [Anaerolineaceae bacterium]